MCRGKRTEVVVVVSIWFACLTGQLLAQGTSIELKFLESIRSDDLHGINRLAVSKDGRFLYGAAWTANRLSAYSRGKNGTLTLVKHVEIPKLLEGVIKLKLNHDDSRLLAICARSNTLLLFARDAATGLLAPDGMSRDGYSWATCCEFSPDSKSVYVGDSGASASLPAAHSSLTVLQVTETGGLRTVQRLHENCLQGIRDIAFDPSGQSGYLACLKADTLVVLRRNTTDGTVQVQQILRDNQGEVDGLDGVCSLAINRDGTRVYSVSGRFEGENAVSVFKRAEDGTLTHLQTLKDIPNFEGGNHIVVTDQERTIFASGSTSSSIAAIERDAATGKLKLAGVVRSTPDQNFSGPSGLALSPDQRYLYVAAEIGSAISIFGLETR